MKTLLVGRFWFEGNRFSPCPTDLAAFERREWLTGEAALAAAADTETELAAVVDFRRQQAGWRVVASRCASAAPGGPIEDPVFERIVQDLCADALRIRPDAVYLSLHGASITGNRDTPELELVERLGAVLRQVGNGRPAPIVATFDLHGNLDPAIAALLAHGSAYRTHPHIDMRSTAARVLARLDPLLAGELTSVGCIAPLGHRLASANMRTAVAPMASIMAFARALEDAASAGSDVSFFGGFPYADTAHSGAAAMAWSATIQEAGMLAQRMRDRIGESVADFVPRPVSPRAGLEQAARLLQADRAGWSP